MLARALLTWLAIVPLMVANGALRDFIITPRLGDPVARAISSITGSGIVFAMAWLFVHWQDGLTAAGALRTGALWLVLTIAFEFGMGLLTGKTWKEMFADYDVRAGRLWILVLISVALAPWIWTVAGD